MTTLSLRLRRARSTEPGSDLRLRFGGSSAPPPPPPPPPPPAPLLGEVRCAVGAPWRGGVTRAAPLAMPWVGTSAAGSSVAVSWRTAVLAGAGVALPWAGLRAAHGAAVGMSWQTMHAASAAMALAWRGMEARRALLAVAWQASTRAGSGWAAGWGVGSRSERLVAVAWGAGLRASVAVAMSATVGVPAAGQWALPWQLGTRLSSTGGPWTPPVPPAPPPPETCHSNDPGSDLRLQFRRARVPRDVGAPAILRFGCAKPALVVVPVRRVYVVANDVSLVRLSDGAEIPALSLSLSLDVDSWAWAWSAAVHPSGAALLESSTGGPVVLQAMVNGTAVRLAVESVQRDREFGRVALKVSGRGISAALSDPYQAVQVFRNTSALTTAQLLEAALPGGWGLDYGLTPWLVPAGVWSHQGTPMSAAVAIAAAGGGYVQPHNTAPVLRVLPRYPAGPWAWADMTPDIHLPASVLQRDGLDPVLRPTYNRVFVAGSVAGGVLGQATRLDTAGDVVAPMVVDPLITHADAVRQRGLQVLADTGRQAWLQWRLPVFESTGIIRPGVLVRGVDGGTTRIGLVRAVSVSYEGGARVWQSLKVETHVG